MRWITNKNLLFIPLCLLSLIVVSVTFSKQIQELISLGSNHKPIRMIKKTEFSDEIKIKSKIHHLKHSIKKNRINIFTDLLADEFEDSLGTIQGKTYAKQLFKTCFLDLPINDRDDYSKRRMPKVKNVTANWDFEIDIKEIDIKTNQKKAQVICNIYYKFDQPDIELETVFPDFLIPENNPGEIISKDEKNRKKDDELITKEKKSKNINIVINLKLKDGAWQIKKLDELFQFVDKRNKKLIKEKYAIVE